jgi:DNA-binding FrmR family transcriptional regulator
MELPKLDGFQSKIVMDLQIRLKRAEGQVRAVREMIGKGDRECEAIIQQLSAATRALDRVRMMLLTHAMQICLREEMQQGGGNGRTIEKIQRMIQRFR